MRGFEKRVRKAISGKLALSTERRYAQEPPSPHLRSRRGDDIALTQARRGDFFGIRWKLVNTFVHGHFTSAFSAGDQSHFEHRANGAVRGKLGCINFTAEAKPGESCFSSHRAWTSRRPKAVCGSRPCHPGKDAPTRIGRVPCERRRTRVLRRFLNDRLRRPR
ncbi:hypothetical protein AB0F64_32610 [Streptomyces sp. NPDC026294]|uniref:hypothetical protein n=1 Tax=Streptomyces sp. NPDC026294 TaxID=3155362 RepID=UPI0033F5DCC2